MNKEIEIYRNKDQVMNEAIDRIIVEIHRRRLGAEYSLLAFTGCSADCGTTTGAINVAIALAMAGWNTILVDCDMRKEGDYKRLNNDIKNGLSDYIIDSGDLNIDDIIYPTNLEHLAYVPCGYANSNPLRLLCSAKMEEMIGSLVEQYSYIIFDLPSVTIMPDAEIIFPFVDGIILVAALGNTTKKQLASAREKVNRYKEKYFGLVVNKVQIKQYKKHIKDYDYFKISKQTKKYKRAIRRKFHKGEGYV